MSPKQKKLAAKAPPPNKLDEKDFKVLREEKAKGRGMGLQDEKVQPGKVMKARRGKIVDDQKRDKRNPNRKPSTKIFDKIGDILKTPYYIRGGKKEKKMGGGMIGSSQRPGYSKGTMVKARGCKLGRTRPTKIT